jgi:taurine-pyruvate aminotransferase
MSKVDPRAIIEADKKHVWHHLTQHKVYEDKDPLFIVEGKGLRVKDINGKEYLDAVSGGVWTVNVGYGRKEIAQAVSDQLTKLCFFANSYGSIPTAKFAEKLISKMPGMSRVYFSNSGSEANEKAFKIVRQISKLKYGGKKYKIIYRERDYHGTTITTLSACGQFERKTQYGPFTPGFVELPHCSEYRSPYGDDVKDVGKKFADELERVILEEGPETVGGVILEPITAGGGVIPPPEGYLERISEICKKYDVLLIIDEVVCGLGRTGKWFGYQHYNIQPDIVTMAKGVASGYAAISCTVTTEKVFQDFIADPADRDHYFRDISTFGGCTAGPTAALANLEIIEKENLLDNVVKMGDYLMSRLHELKDKYPIIGDVRGKGLFCGLELVKDRATKEPVAESVAADVVGECMKQGVIIGKTTRSFRDLNNTLCLSPALICTKADIDEIINALDKSFQVVCA